MKAFTKIIILTISLIVLACDPVYDNLGYPSKVTFAKSGGEKVINGNECIRGIVVDNGHERIFVETIDKGLVRTQLDWLTIETKWPEEPLTLIAASKDEVGGPTEISVELNFGREYGEIKVVRE